jgi:hypothetical protein
MNNIKNDTNNTHSYELSDKGRGVVEHFSHETTSSPYSDASATLPSTSVEHTLRTVYQHSVRL